MIFPDKLVGVWEVEDEIQDLLLARLDPSGAKSNEHYHPRWDQTR